MIPRIKSVQPMDNYMLEVTFEGGKRIMYDVNEDIDTLPGYMDLRENPGLFDQVQLDESRTCIFWSDDIDLPSDMIYEYGKVLQGV